MNRIAFLLFLLFVFSNNIFSQVGIQPVPKKKLEEQKVSLVARGVPLVEVVDYLQKNYHITFSYSDNLISTQKIIYASINKQNINKALEKILFGTTISYRIIGETVVLKNDRQYSYKESFAIDSIRNVMQKPGPASWVRNYTMKDFFTRKNTLERKYQKYLNNTFNNQLTFAKRKDSSFSKKDTLSKIIKTEKIIIAARKVNYWELEFNAIPVKSGRSLKVRTDAGADLIQSKNNNESSSFNLSYSAIIKFHFHRNFYISSGISNINNSINYTTIKYYPLQKMEIQEQKIYYKQKWHYLGIPVLLGANLGRKQWVFSMEVGITPSLLISSPVAELSSTNAILTLDKDNRPPHKKVKDVILKESVEATSHYTTISTFASGSLTVSFSIGHYFKIFAGPYFIASINSIYYKSVPIIENLYGVGGITGIRMKVF